MTSDPLSGKVAFVAGGSGGIGGPLAVALADAGADVAITYRSRPERARDVVAQIQDLGRRAIAYDLDVRDPAAIEATVAAATGALGPIDILLTAIGAGAHEFFLKQDPAEWQRVWETDIRSIFLLVPRGLAVDGRTQGRPGHLSLVGFGQGGEQRRRRQFGGARCAAFVHQEHDARTRARQHYVQRGLPGADAYRYARQPAERRPRRSHEILGNASCATSPSSVPANRVKLPASWCISHRRSVASSRVKPSALAAASQWSELGEPHGSQGDRCPRPPRRRALD